MNLVEWALVSLGDVERRIMVTRHEPPRVMEARINLMQNIEKTRPSLPLFSLFFSFDFVHPVNVGYRISPTKYFYPLTR